MAVFTSGQAGQRCELTQMIWNLMLDRALQTTRDAHFYHECSEL